MNNNKNYIIGKKFTFKNESEIMTIKSQRPTYFYYQDTEWNEYTMLKDEFNQQVVDQEIILSI